MALALLVILSAALYETYFSFTNGAERATKAVEARRQLRQTLDVLRRELAGALYRPGNKRFTFVVEDRDSFGRPASNLTFATTAPPRSDDVRVSDQELVAYQVVEKDGKLALRKGMKDLYLQGEATPYPQMDEIAGFLVECYDGSKWVRSWDTALNAGLPRQVRVTIRMKSGAETAEYSATAAPRRSGG